MNFKKPKMENLTGALVTGGSAVAGAAASNLLVAELTKKAFWRRKERQVQAPIGQRRCRSGCPFGIGLCRWQ